MDIYTYLKKDHKKVATLFEKTLATTSAAKKEELFDQIALELILHSEAEDASFYATLKSAKDTKDIIKHAKGEHQQVKKFIKQIEKLNPDDEEWLETFEQLKDCVSHHVEEEENEIFEQAKKVLDEDQSKQLVEEMISFKEELLNAIHKEISKQS